MGSPIIALTVPDPFDKYIFCEESPELMAGLKARVERIAPTASVTFIPGSCDSEIDRICAEIPKGSSSNKEPGGQDRPPEGRARHRNQGAGILCHPQEAVQAAVKFG